MTPRAIEVAYEDATLRIVRDGALVCCAWIDAPTVTQLREVRRAALEAEREHPSACLNGILRGGNKFPAEVRAEVERNARDPELFTRGVAHLVLLPGWQGPAARAFVRGAIAFARAPAPNRVFSSARAAAAWLAERLDGSTREGVLRAWDAARPRDADTPGTVTPR